MKLLSGTISTTRSSRTSIHPPVLREQRTSNFFLWQAAYAEWVFNEKHFPDITVNDLEAAIREFDARKRRYGG